MQHGLGVHFNRSRQNSAWKKHRTHCHKNAKKSTNQNSSSNSSVACHCALRRGSFPEATYRTTIAGQEWFMGSVLYDASCDRLVKLNNPADELDGPGHEMSDMEVFSDGFHYGRSMYETAGFPPIKTEELYLVYFDNKQFGFIDTHGDHLMSSILPYHNRTAFPILASASLEPRRKFGSATGSATGSLRGASTSGHTRLS